MDRCQWKMVDSNLFTLGVLAERCGREAEVKILRPQRKTDLCLCERHFNTFIEVWGLSHQVQLLNGAGEL